MYLAHRNSNYVKSGIPIKTPSSDRIIREAMY